MEIVSVVGVTWKVGFAFEATEAREAIPAARRINHRSIIGCLLRRLEIELIKVIGSEQRRSVNVAGSCSRHDVRLGTIFLLNYCSYYMPIHLQIHGFSPNGVPHARRG